MANTSGNQLIFKQALIEQIAGVREISGAHESKQHLEELHAKVDNVSNENAKLLAEIEKKHRSNKKLQAELDALRGVNGTNAASKACAEAGKLW